ncbi:MAG: AraC family transcriptional regulator [Erythrobacter sp.]|uniref:helix-turn-helix domain-containing protein n=1 Tax=Erythrobacter sp. TaxID=1042 RepID=UPI0025F406F4|nr:AraC family transcriptional regulator [Erythrobacter sp.]MCL9998729.1 AraC family transcriptional regulator [Erythrobacter sp.]
MTQLATIPIPHSTPLRPAPAGRAPLPDATCRDHALALFRVSGAEGIDRRVAGRALRVAGPPAPAGGDNWFAIAFDAAFLKAAETAHGMRFEPLPAITDPEAHTLAAMIRALSAGETAPDPLLFDSLRHVLLWRLLTLSGEHRQQGAARGGLAPWQARRTTAFLAANIERRVQLGELAAIARLSPFHFARAFARTMGMPPYRYQQALRIERAAELLATSEMRIIEIALAVGYETPQALARVFVQQHGVTPSEWRRRHAQR